MSSYCLPDLFTRYARVVERGSVRGGVLCAAAAAAAGRTSNAFSCVHTFDKTARYSMRSIPFSSSSFSYQTLFSVCVCVPNFPNKYLFSGSFLWHGYIFSFQNLPYIFCSRSSIAYKNDKTVRSSHSRCAYKTICVPIKFQIYKITMIICESAYA